MGLLPPWKTTIRLFGDSISSFSSTSAGRRQTKIEPRWVLKRRRDSSLGGFQARKQANAEEGSSLAASAVAGAPSKRVLDFSRSKRNRCERPRRVRGARGSSAHSAKSLRPSARPLPYPRRSYQTAFRRHKLELRSQDSAAAPVVRCARARTPASEQTYPEPPCDSHKTQDVCSMTDGHRRDRAVSWPAKNTRPDPKHPSPL